MRRRPPAGTRGRGEPAGSRTRRPGTRTARRPGTRRRPAGTRSAAGREPGRPGRARGAQRPSLAQLVAALRHGRIADHAHLDRARAGEARPVRGHLLVVHLGRARLDQPDVHPLTQRADVARVQPQLDRGGGEQRAARGDHEYLRQVAQGELQHFLAVTPRAGGDLADPGVIPGHPQGPQRQHGHHAEHGQEQQHESSGGERPRHGPQHHPADRDGRGERPPPAVAPRCAGRLHAGHLAAGHRGTGGPRGRLHAI